MELVRGRDGIIVTAIGENRLTILEILGIPNSTFEIGEKIYIGKEGRTKVLSVLGKMDYDKISSSAQSELETVVENIVTENESKFVEYLNNAQPLTPRIHALELIPGIGKIYMKNMLEEREKKKFESYRDLQERVGLKEPIKHISERIMDEKRKQLGQHFLNSNSIAQFIVSEAKITKKDTVFEIGTGLGILTPLLCQNANKVISVDV
jgi:putative nucleotide binding protein